MTDVLRWFESNWKEVISVAAAFATILTFLRLILRRKPRTKAILQQNTDLWQLPQVPMQSPVFNAPVTINVSASQTPAELPSQIVNGEPPPIFQAILDVQADMARVGLLRQRRQVLQAAVQSDNVCNVEMRANLRLRLSQAYNDLGETDEADRCAAEAIVLLRRSTTGGEGTL